MDISVGVCAHNEEFYIKKCITSILNQTVQNQITEIIVISSSIDNTDKIVNNFKKIDSRIKLIKQDHRTGKAKAVNNFLMKANSDVLILQSADVIADNKCYSFLIKPLLTQGIGMVGCHPVPKNSDKSFSGFYVNLIWRLHHRISLIQPKTGEVIAFKKKFNKIPDDTAADEAWIESILIKKGYKILYSPKAYIVNEGPKNLRELYVQRKRIMSGHIHLLKKQGYCPSTMKIRLILIALYQEIKENPNHFSWIILCIIFEGSFRINAIFDYLVLNKNPFIWEKGV